MLECTKSLHSFDGKILNVVGKVNVLVEWQGKEKQIEIYVIESNSRFDGLLGQDMLQSFEKKININSIAGTSKIKSIQVDIGLKENAIPIFRKCRPIPLGLRQKVKEDIDHLVSKQYLEKVQYSEWGTPLVIVRKPDGKIRLCADYKITLNPEVSTPTLNVNRD